MWCKQGVFIWVSADYLILKLKNFDLKVHTKKNNCHHHALSPVAPNLDIFFFCGSYFDKNVGKQLLVPYYGSQWDFRSNPKIQLLVLYNL